MCSPIWSFTVMYGLVRILKVLYGLFMSHVSHGRIWSYIFLFSSVWSGMILFGPIRSFIFLYGHVYPVWSFTIFNAHVICDLLWSCRVLLGPEFEFGLVHSCLVLYGLFAIVWSCMVLYGFVLAVFYSPNWASKVLYGPVWSCVVLYGLLQSCMVW